MRSKHDWMHALPSDIKGHMSQTGRGSENLVSSSVGSLLLQCLPRCVPVLIYTA
jgi:hypothetical protein